MITVSDETYERQVLGSGYPVLLAFGKRGELDSRVFGPVLAEYENRMAGRLVVAVVDIDSCPQVCARWGVGEFSPVLVLVRYGVAERVLIGVRSADRIERDLAEYFAPRPADASEPARLSVGGFPKVVVRTMEDVSKAVDSLDPRGPEFMVLSRFDGSGTIQTHVRADGLFDVEWKDGPTADDWRTALSPVPRSIVHALFASFSADDGEWQTIVQWGNKQ